MRGGEVYGAPTALTAWYGRPFDATLPGRERGG